jgi:hypothetical protein
MQNGKVWLGVFAILVLAGVGVGITQCGKQPAELAPKEDAMKPSAGGPATALAETRVEVTFSGGHETDPRDMGRPVALVAGALGVPPEVFREAFSHVRPAPAGQEPDPWQVQLNKQALMSALSPYGVTNDRLDTVSNYYRYVRSRGEMWPTTPAKAYAMVRGGVVIGVTVTDGGSGYSSPPEVTTAGMQGIKLTAKLGFDGDFKKNGRVTEVVVGK